jgi:hypothetical protein
MAGEGPAKKMNKTKRNRIRELGYKDGVSNFIEPPGCFSHKFH